MLFCNVLSIYLFVDTMCVNNNNLENLHFQILSLDVPIYI